MDGRMRGEEERGRKTAPTGGEGKKNQILFQQAQPSKQGHQKEAQERKLRKCSLLRPSFPPSNISRVKELTSRREGRGERVLYRIFPSRQTKRFPTRRRRRSKTAAGHERERRGRARKVISNLRGKRRKTGRRRRGKKRSG